MKLYVKTFGCQMNEYDSARMAEALRAQGYELADTPEQADLMIFNSCSIREKAEQKLISAVSRAARLKRQHPDRVLAVTGCTAQLKADLLRARLPDVDLLVGPDRYGEISDLVGAVRARRGALGQGAPPQGRARSDGASGVTADAIEATTFQEVDDYRFLQARPEADPSRVSAFVTIMKGCDNHCAYCVVPAARGHEVSRPAPQVLREVARMVEAGAREMFLIGQNVNSYRGLPGGFPELLRQVAAVPGVARVRFTTSHPKDLGQDLIDAMAEVPEVCEWLHLPVQAGSSRVLHAMNRGYTREAYLEKVEQVRKRIPDIGLTTDVIVGFPGETPEEFEETLSLLEQVRYDALYSFRYSRRDNTPAARLEDDVPLSEKQARLARLQALQDRITRETLAAEVGKVRQVLVEGPSRRGGGQLTGRSRRNHVINFVVPESMSPPPPGALVDVEVTVAGHHTLEGRLRVATGSP